MSEPAISCVTYETKHKPRWNDFIRSSKNGTFLFDRDYMDYHSDRFQDASRLFFSGDDLLAVMPANVQEDIFLSHGGLTYGGLVSDRKTKATCVLDIFDVLIKDLAEQGIKRIIYKPVPHIYHDVPAEEDLYALFRHGARLVGRDVSSAIPAAGRLPYNTLRTRCIKKAQKSGLRVTRSHDFDTFMEIEKAHLNAKHHIDPVHTAQEMQLLAGRFPEQIKLFAAHEGAEMVAGVIVYESTYVAHAQYIAATERGKSVGALDCILDVLINTACEEKRYFDFGISTEGHGTVLNRDLSLNKEGFGARTTVYDMYEIALTQ